MIKFQRRIKSDISKDLIIERLCKKIYPTHVKEIEVENDTIYFHTYGIFKYMTFEKFYWIDSGSLELKTLSNGEFQFIYQIVFYRFFGYVILMLAFLSLFLQNFISGLVVSCFFSAILFLILWLSHYFQFRSFLKIFKRKE